MQQNVQHSRSHRRLVLRGDVSEDPKFLVPRSFSQARPIHFPGLRSVRNNWQVCGRKKTECRLPGRSGPPASSIVESSLQDHLVVRDPVHCGQKPRSFLTRNLAGSCSVSPSLSADRAISFLHGGFHFRRFGNSILSERLNFSRSRDILPLILKSHCGNALTANSVYCRREYLALLFDLNHLSA